MGKQESTAGGKPAMDQTVIVSFRISKQGLGQIKSEAGKEKCSVSDYIRNCVFKERKERLPPAVADELKAMTEALLHLERSLSETGKDPDYKEHGYLMVCKKMQDLEDSFVVLGTKLREVSHGNH